VSVDVVHSDHDGVADLAAPRWSEHDRIGRSERAGHAPTAKDHGPPMCAPVANVALIRHRASVSIVEFSRELRTDVLAGDITLSVRLWKQPRVKAGGRYRVGPGEIEIDAIEVVPFSAITGRDVRRAGEPDRETLRRRAAHAGPIDDDTLVYRIEFHVVNPEH
jgi:hypothetical protein